MARLTADFRKFVVEGHAFVVFGLALDVFYDSVFEACGNGCSIVFASPSIEMTETAIFLKPRTGMAFNILHQHGERDTGVEFDEHVDVVRYATNAKELALVVNQFFPDKTIEVLGIFRGEHHTPLFRTEHDVVEG